MLSFSIGFAASLALLLSPFSRASESFGAIASSLKQSSM